MREGVGIGGAELWRDERKGVYYLLVSLTVVEVADPHPLKMTRVRGVDVGQRVLATVAGIENYSARFHRDGQRRQARDRPAPLQKKLQRNDTRKGKDEPKRPRSIRRRPRAIDKRVRRLTLSTNHRIAKRIPQDNPLNTLIGVENLTDVRERTDGRKPKKASKKRKKRKKPSKQRSTWPFAGLRSLLTCKCKAALDGGVVIAVYADYTPRRDVPDAGTPPRRTVRARG